MTKPDMKIKRLPYFSAPWIFIANCQHCEWLSGKAMSNGEALKRATAHLHDKHGISDSVTEADELPDVTSARGVVDN